MCVCVYTCNGTQCKREDAPAAAENYEAAADEENAAEAMCFIEANHDDNEVSKRGS